MGAANSGLAAPPVIVNNLDSQTEAGLWQLDFGAGTVGWISTNGVDNSGCVKVVMDSTAATKEISAQWNLQDEAFNAVDYVTIEYDLLIDLASGYQTANGGYGNYQQVVRDAGGSWDATWVGAVGPSYAPSWRHMKFTMPNNNKTYPRSLFRPSGRHRRGLGDVTFYVDNMIISPLQNPLVFGAFTNQSEVANWTIGQKAAVSFSSMDADSDNPPGSLKVDVAYE